MKKLISVSAFALLASTLGAQAQDGGSACLITKTDTNPFFVKMREGAAALHFASRILHGGKLRVSALF